MRRASPDDARVQLPALLDGTLQGEMIEIVREDGAIVALVLIEPASAGLSQARRQFGSARGLISRSDDFDAPLADFDGYRR